MTTLLNWYDAWYTWWLTFWHNHPVLFALMVALSLVVMWLRHGRKS